MLKKEKGKLWSLSRSAERSKSKSGKSKERLLKDDPSQPLVLSV